MEKEINGMQPERYLASILLMDSNYRGASYYDEEDKYADIIASHKNLLINGAKVYTVQTIETDAYVPIMKVEVFSTREKAKEYFDKQVQWYKDRLDTDNYGVVEDETDDSFSWTDEIGFNENALEIIINELEVK